MCQEKQSVFKQDSLFVIGLPCIAVSYYSSTANSIKKFKKHLPMVLSSHPLPPKLSTA